MAASTDRDVVVIGAGLAGLNAALTLEAAGLDVLVLEAQRRVGGRIHSMRQLGGRAEAGGTYIGAGYARVIDVAQRYGVELVDVTPVLEFFREQDLVLGEEIIRQADWPTHAEESVPRARQEADAVELPPRAHDARQPARPPGGLARPALRASRRVRARLAARLSGLSERAIALAYGLNVSFGRDAHDVSALLLLFRGAFSKTQRALAPKDSIGFTARDGVQRIPEAMAGALRGGVELGRGVVGVALERDRATVRCADGTRVSAKHVVAAVPPGVLRAIAIDPKLPPRAGRGRGADSVAARHADLSRAQDESSGRATASRRACSPIPARA